MIQAITRSADSLYTSGEDQFCEQLAHATACL